jgi:hypothetical protein
MMRRKQQIIQSLFSVKRNYLALTLNILTSSGQRKAANHFIGPLLLVLVAFFFFSSKRKLLAADTITSPRIPPQTL